MRRLLSRLLRAERALWTLEPLDPRRELPKDAVERAMGALDRIGAEPPQALTPDEAEWFERTIRPRLAAWLLYDRRQCGWRERRRTAMEARDRRRWPAFWRSQSIFSGNAHRALVRLGLVPAAAPA